MSRLPTRGLVAALTLLPVFAAPAFGAHPSPFGDAGRARPALADPHRALAFNATNGYLVTVDPGAGAAVRAAGGEALDAELGIYLVRDPAAVARIQRAIPDAIVDVDTNRAAKLAYTPDPNEVNQYVTTALGIGALDPILSPDPAVQASLLVIDTGIDLTHPEFAGQPQITAANAQDVQTTQDGAWHGSAVLSTAVAPRQGVGIAGSYPGGPAAMWDGGATGIFNAEIIAALNWAGANGIDVINMSFGASEPGFAEYAAMQKAHAKGILLVAAAGNEFLEGNPIEYPAAYPHVLSVAATDSANAPSVFSNRNRAVDVTAPGVETVGATPAAFNLLGAGLTCTADSAWCAVSGTSFASPITAGAAAWILTQARAQGVQLTPSQLADLLRASASDLGGPGYEVDTGFGLVHVQNAIAGIPAVKREAGEPNDDVFTLRKGAFLLKKKAKKGVYKGWLLPTEDIEDVFRVYVPKKKKVKIVLKRTGGGGDVRFCLWPSKVKTIATTKGFLRCAKRKQTVLTVRNTTKSPVLFLDIYDVDPPESTPPAVARRQHAYTVTVTRPKS